MADVEWELEGMKFQLTLMGRFTIRTIEDGALIAEGNGRLSVLAPFDYRTDEYEGYETTYRVERPKTWEFWMSAEKVPSNFGGLNMEFQAPGLKKLDGQCFLTGKNGVQSTWKGHGPLGGLDENGLTPPL